MCPSWGSCKDTAGSVISSSLCPVESSFIRECSRLCLQTAPPSNWVLPPLPPSCSNPISALPDHFKTLLIVFPASMPDPPMIYFKYKIAHSVPLPFKNCPEDFCDVNYKIPFPSHVMRLSKAWPLPTVLNSPCAALPTLSCGFPTIPGRRQAGLTQGPLPLLFPLPRTHSPRWSMVVPLFPFRSLLKCHLFFWPSSPKYMSHTTRSPSHSLKLCF